MVGDHLSDIQDLKCWVAQLLDDVVECDCASLEPHQQLLRLGPGEQLQVERVLQKVTGQLGRQLAVRHPAVLLQLLLQDLLLGRGVAGQRGGDRVGPHHAGTERWRGLARESFMSNDCGRYVKLIKREVN